MTVEEFCDWCQRDEHRDRNFELEAGVVVELPLTGMREGVVCANLCGILGAFVRASRTGYVCSNNVGLILERDPDTVLGPDIVLFLGQRRFDELENGFLERMPTLVVEVLSPHDTYLRMTKRVGKFLLKGVPIVWVVDAGAQTVVIYSRDQSSFVLKTNQEVTGQDVLPGFRCKVSDIFAMAGE